MTPSPTLDAPELPQDVDETSPATAPQDDFGVNNRDLPTCLKNAILDAIKQGQNQEKYIRRQEILQDSQHRFYDMDIQFIYQSRDYCWTQASPGGNYIGPNGDEESFGEYLDTYNIFTAFGEIPRAKLSENMPGIDFQPVDPNDHDDVEAANSAEGMRHDYDRNNDIKTTQKEITYHLQMGGRVVAWTRIEDADQKFGVSRSGAPEKRSTTTICGCVEAKVPIFANNRADFWYCILYDDPDIKIAKTKYSWIADKLRAGQICLDENAYERVARLGVIQGAQGSRLGFRIGDSIAHLITRANVWLRLSAFEDAKEPYEGPNGQELIEDEQDGVSRAKEIREKLAEIYPDGVHVCVVGDQYAESWNQSMDDCISVGHAYIGKGQSRMPMMKPMVIVQDRFNSSMNFIAETNDFCVPSTWVSCDTQEYDAITKQKSAPGMIRNMKQLPPGVASVANAVYHEPGTEIPKSFQDYLEYLSGALPQFQLAVPPSIWGESLKDQKTASGYQLAATQAMGILGAFWVVQVQIFADIYYHHCLAVMNEPDYPEQITVSGPDGRVITVQKASLTKGNFRAFPDTESGFPESTVAKRQTFSTVVTQLENTPLAAQILGSPDNVAEMVRVYGVPELVIPEAVSRDKQLREIETLLKQTPRLAPPIAQLLTQGADIPTLLQTIKGAQTAGQAIAAAAAQQQEVERAGSMLVGQQPPPAAAPFDPSSIAAPSLRVWESDYHVWEAKKCRDWLSSEDRYTEETIGQPDDATGENKPNIAGILNVILHMKEHDAYAAAEAPPVSGPLPAPNVTGKVPPQLTAPPAAPAAPAAAIGA